ncbi:MAG: sigma-54 dependent transcriptional regulator [Rhizobium sp.]|nr:sigma-54 dependent transcriptional regulator [Rhizobium sp.]
MTTIGIVHQRTPKSGGEQRPAVLIAEDDRAMRLLIAKVLEASSTPIEIVAVENAHEAMGWLENREVAVVVTDLRMPGAGGLDLLEFVKKSSPMTQVVLVTGYATVESAVRALKGGAYDYVLKPFDNDELCRVVMLALERYLLATENQRLRQQSPQDAGEDSLIGQSRGIEGVRRLVEAAAAHDCSVFIFGESGSGKELVARQIHTLGHRREHRFVAVNCAAIPDNLIESELFGYKRGAFTGAERDKVGLFSVANGGTLFLDEINSASLAFQAKLMRVLQDGSFFPMGATEPVTVDVQVLAATNKPIKELVERQEFREDLYYRLMVMEITVPPLRERTEDIAPLAYHFLATHAERLHKPAMTISTEALGVLKRYLWPGNVRELENIVQRMIILSEGDAITLESLPERLLAQGEAKVQAIDYFPPKSLEEIEAFFIRKTLRETQGDRAMAAEILGIDKSTLWRKIKRYQIE